MTDFMPAAGASSAPPSSTSVPSSTSSTDFIPAPTVAAPSTPSSTQAVTGSTPTSSTQAVTADTPVSSTDAIGGSTQPAPLSTDGTTGTDPSAAGQTTAAPGATPTTTTAPAAKPALPSPPASGPGTPAWANYQTAMLAAGQPQSAIDAMSANYDSTGNPIPGTAASATSSTPNPDGSPIGVGLGNWSPGDTYTGTGSSSGDSLMTDTTFTAAQPNNSPTMTPWNVTPDQTVSGQMDQLTKNMSSNPVYQSLADSLTRAQAEHGGENSLMAQTAAYNGVVNMAFNIASADAATYAKSAEFNASTANQFSLATQQFQYQALLSTQNYQQSQVLQTQQIQGNLQSVSMQVAGQIKATQISAGATVSAAGISANAQITSAHINADTTLKSIQANFDNTWMLNEQQTGSQMELSDRNTDNQIRAQQLQANSTMAQAITVQANADRNANLRQLMSGVATIGATPGLTPEQQQGATQQLTSMYQTNQDVSTGFYGSIGYSVSSGQLGANATGTTSSAVNAAAATGPGGPTYQKYGDYLSYGQGGFTYTAPPVSPFDGGNGLPQTAGGLPAYGSNQPYAESTGNTASYVNPLSGTNPVGNSPRGSAPTNPPGDFLPPGGP